MDAPREIQFTDVDTWQTGYADKVGRVLLLLTTATGQSFHIAVPPETALEFGKAVVGTATQALGAKPKLILPKAN